MFDEYQICPYTGLRSFTEEESLYFKGREEHIEHATEQLKRNKFLMLTGASGDGKSSLVYAGIVPNARAGFLKSKYSQWSVVDFRPERTPFTNLCRSLAKQLHIANTQIVESELQHGFSALVDLYKNSSCYVDVDSIAWQQAEDGQKAALKRGAANLMIIVDQFEEFFTNPENYHNGIPSQASNLVLNVLLETARIALEEDLPIYIVFTMRSDYIGQCAAFRSLPEYIGFSQFFVPRLNRSQLQQVIEEPATLSGNRISRRLTERLIHDIAEGVDQLPILQHALNQIWHAANRGKEEMDLIHYAMVGGMPAQELPDDQTTRFTKWFDGLTEQIKKFYLEPNLQNVLDTHANKLYESAAASYQKATGKELSEEKVKAIIKTTFSCLTKIDQSRAVRNRMTLKEIHAILNRADIDVQMLGLILNIFREPGNTFIRPFITEEPESNRLGEDAVLDITHESLIRNWEYLEQWAKEEFDNYTISQDFEQQLNRWVESRKSSGYLLSIGPLTYFENWYNKVSPNSHWIARYLPQDVANDKKLEQAKLVLSNSQEFLLRSARKHAVTRTIMRYGPRRIAAAAGLIAVLTLSSFALNTYLRQQNSYVLKSIHQQTLKLASNPKVIFGDKITLICQELKLGQATVDEVVASIHEPIEKINIATGIATLLIFQGRDEPKNEIFRSLTLADSLLELIDPAAQTSPELSSTLKRINDLRVTLELGYHYNADPQIAKWRKRNAERSARWAIHVATSQPKDYTDIQSFSLALENALNNQTLSDQEITKLLAILSPLENTSLSTWVKQNFQRDNLLVRGSLDYGYKFNGLYQFLAYLYGANGNSTRALQCMDTLLYYSQNNYLGDYAAGVDNATHIASVYFRNGRTKEELDAFVKGYCLKKPITEEEFYAGVLGRTLHSNTTTANLHLYWFMGVNSNLNLQFSSRDQLSYFFKKYREVVGSTIRESNQRNFLLALSYKNEGILKALNKEKPKPDELNVSSLFDEGFKAYRMVDQKYLDQTSSIIGVSQADQIIVPRKYLFIYPDLKVSVHPLEPRSFFFFYSGEVFLEYILKNNLFDWLYPTQSEIGYFSDWFRDYNSKMFIPRGFITKRAQPDVLKNLEVELKGRKADQQMDLNWLYLYLGLEAQNRGDTAKMVDYYRNIKPENIFNILRSKEFANNINNQSFRMIAHAVKGLLMTNHIEEAYKLIAVFKKPMNRSSLYAFAAVELEKEKYEAKLVQRLIDSSYVELNRLENLTTGQPNRQVLAFAVVMRDPSATAEASRLIKNIGNKFVAMQRVCQAQAFHSQLHEAQASVPQFISDSDHAIFLWNILYGHAIAQATVAEGWSEFNSYYVSLFTQWIFYIDESN